MKKQKQPEPETIRFSNAVAPVVPGYTITNLSEADVKELNQGRVPGWIIDTTDAFLAWNQGPAAGMKVANEQLRKARTEEAQAVDAVREPLSKAV